MGESARRRKERRGPIKPTEKLPPLPLAKDRQLSDKQRTFCCTVVEAMLDDKTSISFSKPVGELWDLTSLPDYFQKITRPMDLGTVLTRATSADIYTQAAAPDLFDANRFREEVRLVFLNAILYNGRNSELGRLAAKFINFIDAEMSKMPLPVGDGGESAAGVEGGMGTSGEEVGREGGETGKASGGGGGRGRGDAGAVDENGGVDEGDGASDDKGDIESRSGRKKGTGVDTPDKGGSKAGSDDSPKRKGEDDGERDVGGGHSHSNDDDDDGEAKSDPKSDDKDVMDDGDDERPGGVGEGGDGEMNGDSNVEEAERERLVKEIETLTKSRARADATIAEIELEKNVPLTYEENSKLRDEVEALPWEKSQKVVQILQKYVDEALRDCEDSDPEFVTLEFSTVEPRLLREIESLIRPDPRVEKERAAIDMANRGIEAANRKLKRMRDGALLGLNKKKRAKKSR